MAAARRRTLERALEGVDGWFRPGEAWALHEAVRRLESERPVTLVEIGSFHGRSTIAAALGLLSRAGGGRLHAVDPQDDERFETLRANLAGVGVDAVVNPIRSSSRAARDQFDGVTIDLIFIDGSHRYADVSEDLAGWLPLVRSGGVVAVHDLFWPGVARALSEHLAVGGPLRSPRYVDDTLLVVHAPGERWTDQDSTELRRLRVTLTVGRCWFLVQAKLDARWVPSPVRGVLIGLARMIWRVSARVTTARAAQS